MNACELTAAISALASLLAERLPDDQLALTAAIFTQLGDTLTTISVHRETCNSAVKTDCSKNRESDQTIREDNRPSSENLP